MRQVLGSELIKEIHDNNKNFIYIRARGAIESCLFVASFSCCFLQQYPILAFYGKSHLSLLHVDDKDFQKVGETVVANQKEWSNY